MVCTVTHPPNQVLTSSDSRLLDMVCTMTHLPNQVLASVALVVGIWQSLTPICPHPKFGSLSLQQVGLNGFSYCAIGSRPLGHII